MTVQYSTRVERLNVDGSNVIQSIDWALVGHDGEFGAEVPFTTEIPREPKLKLIPFDDLTHDVVGRWAEQHADADALAAAKEQIAGSIGHQRAAQVVEMETPWAARDRIAREAAEAEAAAAAAAEAEKAKAEAAEEPLDSAQA